VIEVRGLTRRYGDVLAVDDLSFDVEPGKVTGFLGPNGVGKSTTMRIMLGPDRPTSGTALVNGRPCATFTEPLREVGALLDPGSAHHGRTGRSHLRVAARTSGIPARRVDEVIERVGLDRAARRRIKGYSLARGSVSASRRR
jgi:ABC-2 type transport system ATP-binding protein